jgi:hypothetical protein
MPRGEASKLHGMGRRDRQRVHAIVEQCLDQIRGSPVELQFAGRMLDGDFNHRRRREHQGRWI